MSDHGSCIFCLESDKNFTSVEHVLPESLGNVECFLPRGIVCDQCNNYFARKVEKPVLDHPHLRQVRYLCGVKSKRGAQPFGKGWFAGIDESAQLRQVNEGHEIYVPDAAINQVSSGRLTSMIIPSHFSPPRKEMSKFICKIAYEFLAFLWMNGSGWREELRKHTQLEQIRKFVRYGSKRFYYDFHYELLIKSKETFDDKGERVEILSEYWFDPEKPYELIFNLVLDRNLYVFSMSDLVEVSL